ncbi:MAG: hypothetical protein FJ096_04205 [Deltaproteobacteria bacterium]|nr:hypothetical protein [Deltaproteobacteria bacterium]
MCTPSHESQRKLIGIPGALGHVAPPVRQGLAATILIATLVGVPLAHAEETCKGTKVLYNGRCLYPDAADEARRKDAAARQAKSQDAKAAEGQAPQEGAAERARKEEAYRERLRRETERRAEIEREKQKAREQEQERDRIEREEEVRAALEEQRRRASEAYWERQRLREAEAVEALREAERQACATAAREGTIKGWKTYLHDWPDGRCAERARSAVEACAVARRVDSVETWRTYLEAQPNGACLPEAKAVVADLEACERALEPTAVAARLAYLDGYPSGRCRERVIEAERKHRPSRAPLALGLSLGGATLLAGGILAGLAARESSALESACPGKLCEAENAETLVRAGSLADAATGTLIAGSALVTAGLVTHLVLHRNAIPEEKLVATTVRLLVGPRFVGVGGTF